MALKFGEEPTPGIKGLLHVRESTLATVSQTTMLLLGKSSALGSEEPLTAPLLDVHVDKVSSF